MDNLKKKHTEHEAKWKDVGEPFLARRKGLFGNKKSLLFHKCCGERMSLAKLMQKRSCETCGNEEVYVADHFVVICDECGHYYSYNDDAWS